MATGGRGNPGVLATGGRIAPIVGAKGAGVAIQSEDGTLLVLARLWEDAPKVTGGYANWEDVARPGRRALTVYRGTDAPEETIALVLDGLASDSSVEGPYRTLEIMAGLGVPGDPEPPKLFITGQAVPHDSQKASQNRWVITGFTENDVTRRADGQRLRSQVDLTFKLFTEAAQLEKLKPRKSAPRYKATIARAGDTYLKIAARALGTQRLGRRLAQLNDDRDPSKKLRAGQKIRLPSAHLLSIWKREL